MVKKLISVILSLAICLGVVTCAFAQTGQTDYTEYPVIIVPGYSGSPLEKINEDGSAERLWHPDFKKILNLVLKRAAEIGIGLGEAALGKADYIAKIVGEEAVNMLGDLACNPDGTSVKNVKPVFYGAECSSHKALYDKFGDESYRFEPDISRDIMEHLDMSMIFNFNNDWRMNAVDIAAELDGYIQEVKRITGKDKVNIFAISHGGQVTGTYLSLYGEKCDVDNALMTVPALGGAGMMYDLLCGEGALDEENLLRFIENGLMLEEDYHLIFKAQQLGFLDPVIQALVPYLFSVAGYWGSMWDFCPAPYYEAMKAKFLDPVKSKTLIEKSDRMHNEIMPDYGSAFAKCRDEYGMNINIIAGTGNSNTTGGQMNSDGIIPVFSSTGATVAPYGKRFADGYTQVEPCDGNYKVSPDMAIDASTAYMPDNTWFVDGMFHGMMVWDDFTKELMMKLLLTDEITSVYSDKKFPQFHYSTNASYAIHFAFDNSVEGYLDKQDGGLVVKNLSQKGRTIIITSIHMDGVGANFLLKGKRVLKPGESVFLRIISGGAQPVENMRASVTVNYIVLGSLTPFGSRTEYFTNRVFGMSKVEYIGPYADYAPKTMLDYYRNGALVPLCKKLGIFEIVNRVIDFIDNIFEEYDLYSIPGIPF